MEFLLFIAGIVLILAAIDKLKIFGAAPELDKLDKPLSTRQKAAGIAALSGDLTRSAFKEARKLPATIDGFNDSLDKWNREMEIKLSQKKSPLGKSLTLRRIWLSTMLETNKRHLEIEDQLDADPELRKIYEDLSKKRLGEDETVSIESKIAESDSETLKRLGFTALPANIRLVSIPFLCHCTRIENLQSILQQGIVPVGSCAQMNIHPVVNDTNRFDRRTSTSSLSIGHPNERMLYKYRKANPGSDWVILAVNTATALNLNTLFCRHNAADSRIRSQPDHALRGNKAFQAMFTPPLQDRGQARYNQPLDTQAEILIPRVIQPDEIQGVFFLSDEGYEQHRPSCGDRAVFTPSQSEAVFGKRIDADSSGTAGIIREFNWQIGQLSGSFKKDRRLFEALDKRITSANQAQSSTFGHLMNRAWLDYAKHGRWVHSHGTQQP